MNETRWPVIFCMVGLGVWIVVMTLIMILGINFKIGASIFFAMTSSYNVVCSIIVFNHEEMPYKDRVFLSTLFMFFSISLIFFCYKLFNGQFTQFLWASFAMFSIINAYGVSYLISKMGIEDDEEDFY